MSERAGCWLRRVAIAVSMLMVVENVAEVAGEVSGALLARIIGTIVLACSVTALLLRDLWDSRKFDD